VESHDGITVRPSYGAKRKGGWAQPGL
jgi:hypothetical protein